MRGHLEWNGHPNPRSGIALVVVLGFLTILVLMSLAFTVVMRTERLASRAFSDVARARFIAEAGLARAMSDLDGDLQSAGIYPLFTTGPGLPDVFHSRPGSDIDFLRDIDPLRYAPIGITTNQRLSGWQEILDPTDNRIIGRYAYLVLNSSGLLDINRAGGTNRAFGADAREIQLHTNLLSELTDYGASAIPTLLHARWRRFESLPDLLALGRAHTNVPIDNLRSTVSQITNIFIFSHAPSGWLDASSLAVQPVTHVGSNFNAAAVQSAFATITNAVLALQMREALTDYTDSNFRPERVNSITVEPTPLINEIVIDQTYVGGTNLLRPRVEVWYPFVGITNPNSYTLVLGLRVEGALPADYNPPNYVGTASLSGPWTSPRFVVTNLTPASATSTNPPVSFAGMRARIVAAQLREGATVIDALTNSTDIDLSFALAAPAVRSGGIAVTDPRLNHLEPEWRDVGASAGGTPAITLGELNAGVANPLAGDGLAATNIFIANRPLRNTGELGLLFYGEPWRTVPLLGPNAWPVLHRFSVVTNETYSGRVNINTPNEGVLATALLNTRADLWPGAPNAVTLTVAQARSIAGQIIATTINDPLVNVGEIGPKFPSGAFTGFNALESESILRNTADLLTTRQQLFTAFVAGQAYDASGNPAAKRLMVAVIWRDPFPNADGRNDWFVRFFKWLESSE